MTLLDYFAGQALNGTAANIEWMKALSQTAKEADISAEVCVARSCYEFAEAMLKERKRRMVDE